METNLDAPHAAERRFPDFLSNRRNPLIDVLRGLAIILVLFAHFPVFWAAGSGRLFGRDESNIREGMGYYGVAIFFVLSGFLITSVTLRRYGQLNKIDSSAFWWMRFSRIMPMLLASLVAMALFHFLRVPHFVLPDDKALWENVSAALSFRFCDLFNSPRTAAAWDPLWSLSVEEMFYLAFPFVCLAVNGFGSAVWLSLAIIASAVYLRLAGGVSPFSTPGCMDLLALGCLVALSRPDRLRRRLPASVTGALAGALGLAGLLLIGISVFSVFPLDQPAWASLRCGIGAAAALVATQLLDVPARVRLALLPISALGVVSYELYLVHMPLMAYLTAVLPFTNWGLIFLAAMVAVGVHEFFSEPMNRMLRDLAKKTNGADEAERLLRRKNLRRCALLAAAAPLCLLLAAWTAGARSRPSVVEFRITSIADLPAGSQEPVAYAGKKTAGDLVYLRHEGGGLLRLGIDHWAGTAVLSAPISAKELTGGLIKVSFRADGLSVECDGKTLLKSSQGCYDTKPGPLGTNPGFSTAVPRASSTIVP